MIKIVNLQKKSRGRKCLLILIILLSLGKSTEFSEKMDLEKQCYLDRLLA